MEKRGEKKRGKGRETSTLSPRETGDFTLWRAGDGRLASAEKRREEGEGRRKYLFLGRQESNNFAPAAGILKHCARRLATLTGAWKVWQAARESGRRLVSIGRRLASVGRRLASVGRRLASVDRRLAKVVNTVQAAGKCDSPAACPPTRKSPKSDLPAA